MQRLKIVFIFIANRIFCHYPPQRYMVQEWNRYVKKQKTPLAFMLPLKYINAWYAALWSIAVAVEINKKTTGFSVSMSTGSTVLSHAHTRTTHTSVKLEFVDFCKCCVFISILEFGSLKINWWFWYEKTFYDFISYKRRSVLRIGRNVFSSRWKWHYERHSLHLWRLLIIVIALILRKSIFFCWMFNLKRLPWTEWICNTNTHIKTDVCECWMHIYWFLALYCAQDQFTFGLLRYTRNVLFSYRR